MSNTEALRAAAQQALVALVHHTEQTRPIQRTADAIAALRAALAQPAQPDADLQRRTGEPHIDGWPLYSGLPQPAASGEPVAHVGDLIIQVRERVMAGGAKNRDPLYAAQPAPALVPLTDAEIDAIRGRAECWEHVGQRIEFRHRPFARAVLAAAGTPAKDAPQSHPQR